MCIRVSASTTLVFVAFSMVNFVFPLCKTASACHAQAGTTGAFWQIDLFSSSTLWHQEACCEAMALGLPCQIFALCSGTDVHHAASAQKMRVQLKRPA